jgi:hypothetical protein
MNWNNDGKRNKDCNNLKAIHHFDRLLGLCRNPSQTLTNMAGAFE